VKLIQKTHRLEGVGCEAGRLPVRLGEVVRKPLVLSLLGAQLHKLTLHKVGKHLQAQKIQA